MSKVRLASAVSKTVGGGTPARDNPEFWNGGIPWASVKDFKDGSYKLTTTQEEISKKGLKLSASHLIPAGTPIVCTRMAVGRIASAGRAVAINQDLRALYVNDHFDTNYLIFAVDSIRPQIENVAVGSTVKGINIDHLLDFEIFGPAKPEQTKIAEVLSTVGCAIEETEALVAKLVRIKTGLMQDLLTRGIDEHGNIRCEEAHEFKDSPVGRIPADWICESLSHFVPSAEYGISTSLGEFGEPVLRMNNLVGGEVDLSALKYTNRPVPEHLWLRWGDVLFNRTNSWEHVGRTGLWRKECDRATFASYLVRLNPDRSILCPELLNTWLNWSKMQIEMRRFATPAVQQVNINPTNLRKMRAAFPSMLDEQNEIVLRLNKHSDALRATRAVLDKLRSLKTGLMQDLLSGRKRVTLLLEAVDRLTKRAS